MWFTKIRSAIRSLLNPRSFLALVGIVIVTATIFYSRYLAKKIAVEERQKGLPMGSRQQSHAQQSRHGPHPPQPPSVTVSSRSPLSRPNEKDSIIDYINLDSARAALD